MNKIDKILKDHSWEEVWESKSEMILTDIDDIEYWRGRIIMTKSDFRRALEEIRDGE